MTPLEEEYFTELTRDRTENANTLDKPSMQGAKDNAVEKYSDQAHFIYELLQNADDAGATHARFILENNRLIFSHNGTRHFSISDPSTEKADAENGCLGDVNSITSIGNSSKSVSKSKIGKFGVGFKAVFQYTSTPHIYDPVMCFRIERFIVPVRLTNDFPGREPGDTLFVFPFDHAERKADEAFDDISEKLRSLKYPVLFLSNLKTIYYQIGNLSGEYSKEIDEELKFSSTAAQLISLTKNTNSKSEDKLWLFSRVTDNDLKYSVGFLLGSNGLPKPVKEPAFCFFPTKERTELRFMIHAPFLLTDSREGIRAAVPHNKKMISLLANLAADSLVYLKDIGIKKGHSLITDDIVDIIPIDENEFGALDDRQKISFLPFFTQIKEKLGKKAILPADSGYVKSEHAYWAFVPQISKLFSNEQLSEIVQDPNAKWVFKSIGRQDVMRKNKALAEYIDSITVNCIDEETILSGKRSQGREGAQPKQSKRISGITPSFIEHQKITWLGKFYKWLSETNKRTEAAKKLPIFLDQKGKAVPAYVGNERCLFLPCGNESDYTVVKKSILRNKDAAAFIEKIGVKAPDLKDEIFNKILPKCSGNVSTDMKGYFQKLFTYYKSCPIFESGKFADKLSKCQILNYSTKNGRHTRQLTPDKVYYPTDELKKYFDLKPDTAFLDMDFYSGIVPEEDFSMLAMFFGAIGIHYEPIVTKRIIGESEAVKLGLPHKYPKRDEVWSEPEIDGCSEILEFITDKADADSSIILWKQLVALITKYCHERVSPEEFFSGTYSYFYYGQQHECFESSISKKLRAAAWILDTDGAFKKASSITLKTISDKYDTQSEASKKLIDFLGISEELTDKKLIDDSNLSLEQLEDINLGRKLKKAGISSEEEIIEFIKWREAKNKPRNQNSQPSSSEIYSRQPDIQTGHTAKSNRSEAYGAITDFTERSQRQINRGIYSSEKAEQCDSDEFMRPAVDFGKMIERAKEKSADEFEQIERLEELYNIAEHSGKYTFGWFKALLELEIINKDDSVFDVRDISISFSLVEREKGTERTLILKHPSRYIPQFMEDLSDIPLELHIGKEVHMTAIEVVNIRSYSLRVKLRANADIDGIDLSKVTEAKIEAKNPSFLLKKLNDCFLEFTYDDKFNMQQNLCKNIEFIFGPPGTGKTTHLVKKVILPLIDKQKPMKILVLTPTNKSADVIVNRVAEIFGKDRSYEKWLVRFGSTNDENIEKSKIFKDKTFDIRTMSQSVTVTTIARFPYDYFMPDSERLYLNAINWDYIIIDEASMIPITNIVYPLYKKVPKKFIIAGDPFQIEPITSIDMWKGENIYSMVNLNSFFAPNTIPHRYKVTTLKTQYRSVPAIGNVFSKLTYDGILKHYRSDASQKELGIEEKLEIRSLNIIKFPVSRYESIYRAKKLNGSSSYQVYSALFTHEFTVFLSRSIAELKPKERFSIGIIAPYRAQADLIEKLTSSVKIPGNIELNVGTIHSFQGDECDIVIAVFNPPPVITDSNEMFLNKLNIINVSLSRARDYLFMIMPDGKTDNISNLKVIKKAEDLFRSGSSFREFSSHEIEKIMFGSENYLEDNTFTTGHQSVNVYAVPEKRYEFRSEDSAIDVQVRKVCKH